MTEYWIPSVYEEADTDSLFCFSNKCDTHKDIPAEQKYYFENNGLLNYETSAKTGWNVTEAIIEVVQLLMAKHPKEEK